MFCLSLSFVQIGTNIFKCYNNGKIRGNRSFLINKNTLIKREDEKWRSSITWRWKDCSLLKNTILLYIQLILILIPTNVGTLFTDVIYIKDMSFKLFCIIIAELEQIIAKLKNEIKNHDEAQQYAKIINMTKKEY